MPHKFLAISAKVSLYLISFFIIILCLLLIYIYGGSKTTDEKPIDSASVKPALAVTQEQNPIIAEPKARIEQRDNVASSEKSYDVGIFECIPDFFFDYQTHENRVKQHLSSLANSSNENRQISYALYSETTEQKSRLDLLIEHNKQFPNNKLVSMDLIRRCADKKDKRCTDDIINKAIASDPNNGAIWLRSAIYYAATEDELNFINAAAEIEKSAVFNERYGETLLHYTQSLAGSSENNFNINALTGLSKAVAFLPQYSELTNWCEHKYSTPRIAESCLVLGKQMEMRSQTLITSAIGVEIQKGIYQKQNDLEALEMISAKQKKSASYTPPTESEGIAQIMMLLDERLLRSWVNNIDVVGEKESHLLVVQEAKALYEKNENMICTLAYDFLNRL